MFAKAFLSLRSVVSGRVSGITACAVVASLIAVGGVARAAAPDVVPVTGSRPVADRVVQPVNDAARVTLHGTVHPLATRANDLGAVPDGAKLERVQVMLKRSDAQETELKQLISDMHTPGSASYHQWLTPDSFGKRFGPSDADIAKVQGWLASHGFSVGKVNAGRQTLEFTGTAGQFRDTFHAQIHSYTVKGGTHFANSVDPQIPVALAPVFGGFASLNNFPLKSYSHMLGKGSYNTVTHESKPDWTTGDSTGVSLALAPGDYAVQYDLPSAASGNDGTGTSVAIINEANIDVPTVDRFRTLFNLPANSPTVIIDGNDPGIDGNNNPDGPNGASGEAYLDVEWAGAIAPKATINLVIGADTVLESGLALAAERAVYSDLSPIISISFGNCEFFLGSGNNFWNTLWEQAAAQGITVLVSSGDSGSAGCDDANSQEFAVNGQEVSGIATTPFNVAVGGTDFYYTNYNGSQSALNTEVSSYWNLTPSNSQPTVSLLKPVPEQPWNDSQFGLNFNSFYSTSNPHTTIAAASGGPSNCASATLDSNGNTVKCLGGYAKPSWQTGTGVPADTVRDIPDVSLFAANGQNASFYPICVESADCVLPATTIQFSKVGGTSASTPSFAGIMALINQKYGRQGQANYVLYPLAAQYPAAFHDVTVGTNTVPCNLQTITYSGGTLKPSDCQSVPAAQTLTGSIQGVGSSTEGEIAVSGTVAYNAGTGYDLASGLGTIDASVLINDWNKITFNATSVTLVPSKTTFTHGTTVGISGTVTGSPTPTGDVALMTDSTVPLNQGEAIYTLSGGTYSGSLSFLPGGTYNVWGNYGGDGSNAGSSSTKTQITVAQEASTTALSLYSIGTTQFNNLASGGSVSSGTVVVLSAQPQSSASIANDTAPTGTVVFSDNGTLINTAVINAEGDAEFDFAFAAGSHSITAAYSGDASYGASTAGPYTFTITQAVAGISLTPGSAITIASQGGSGPSTFSVTPSNGFAGSVALTCSITSSPTNAIDKPTCSLSPASVTFAAAATAAQTSTLTVNTTAPTTAHLDLPTKTIFSLGGGVALAGLIFLGAGFGRRGRQATKSIMTIRLLSAAAFFALIAGATIGCGSGGGGGGTTSGGTTIGSYVVTVKATPATGTAQTATVAVTVN